MSRWQKIYCLGSHKRIMVNYTDPGQTPQNVWSWSTLSLMTLTIYISSSKLVKLPITPFYGPNNGPFDYYDGWDYWRDTRGANYFLLEETSFTIEQKNQFCQLPPFIMYWFPIFFLGYLAFSQICAVFGTFRIFMTTEWKGNHQSSCFLIFSQA